MGDENSRSSIYVGDSIRWTIEGYESTPQSVAYGTDVEGVFFDGYPQIVKEEGSRPVYEVKKEKDIMVAMRDGVRIAVDIYRPDVEGEKFPAILAWGMWGKDAQEAVAWTWDKQQAYYDTPFWDGSMEAGNYMYTVPRGYAHVIPEPRGIGNSEGVNLFFETYHHPDDIYDIIEWIAAQPWCTGKVGMMGPSSYAQAQMSIAPNPPPHLVAIRPDECVDLMGPGIGDSFHGIWDTLIYHIWFGRHGNDSTPPPSNSPETILAPKMLSLPKEELERRLEEALNHPDIKYNTKWYSNLKYPMKHPIFFDQLLDSFHPSPIECDYSDIKIPFYAGTPWVNRLYIWGTFALYEQSSTPDPNRKVIVYPPGFPPRPYASYHDEALRWYDHWLKGIDTGIMDEPPIKLFVMGVNKWRFENEWPLARTEWTKFYLHPEGGLSAEPVEGTPEPESFTQPAPYLDPKIYCLRYSTGPLDRDTEITGPIALYLEASIDINDTNWMVDLVDVDPEGNRQWLSVGYLKAGFRALDEAKSKPYQPIHPRQDPVPVPPGQKIEYAIAMMPTSNLFLKGHSMELIIRNQDDVLSRLGTWGVYMLPFMQTVTHHVHFGRSHLLLPVIP
jgi:hypothetical protein|tara:strand:- start:5170 stop:7005 length:1836 start_codon:yes stop_codon:yes gene_type:complete